MEGSQSPAGVALAAARAALVDRDVVVESARLSVSEALKAQEAARRAHYALLAEIEERAKAAKKAAEKAAHEQFAALSATLYAAHRSVVEAEDARLPVSRAVVEAERWVATEAAREHNAAQPFCPFLRAFSTCMSRSPLPCLASTTCFPWAPRAARLAWRPRLHWVSAAGARGPIRTMTSRNRRGKTGRR